MISEEERGKLSTMRTNDTPFPSAFQISDNCFIDCSIFFELNVFLKGEFFKIEFTGS